MRLENLSVVFLGDEEMTSLHDRAMGDASPTDILTFDYGEGVAEIFISLDTARRQARQNRMTLEKEIRLYLAHGLLHLSGYDDRSPSQRRRMRLAEQTLLKQQRIESIGTV